MSQNPIAKKIKNLKPIEKTKIFKINTPLPPPTKNAKLTKTLNHTDRKTVTKEKEIKEIKPSN